MILILSLFSSGCIQKPTTQIKPTLPSANTRQNVSNQQKTTEIQQKKEALSSPSNNETAQWQIYESKKYGFVFRYPKNLVITSASNENGIVISDEENGHWIYDIEIENNLNNYALEKIFRTEVHNKNTIVNDIIIDGRKAKRYSINNDTDYGNAGVFLLFNNYILIIYGDDSIKSDKINFDLLISTFKFIK